MLRNNYFVLVVGILSVFLFQSCEPEIKEKTSGKPFFPGDANFSRYVAVGGDFLSGISDSEVFVSGQTASISAILAGQFKRVGGGAFRQPLMFDELGFGNRQRLMRVTDCKGAQDVRAVNFGGTPDPRNQQSIGNQGPFSNVAVPMARAVDLNTNSYAGSNPYFSRFASTATASILDDAQLMDPSFFVLWVGENDVLPYAKTGGSFGLNSPTISTVAAFRSGVETSVQKLVSRGAMGVIATIPSIAALPFFTTVPYNSVEVTQAEADQLNLIYFLNTNIRFHEGKNPFVIRDGLFQRFAEPDEYILLPIDLDSVKCGGYGSLTALPDEAVLTRQEIQQVSNAIDQFNDVIRDIAASFNLALFDAKSLFGRVSSSGINFDGITYTSQYINGGFISLDGIHPTKRGNAIIANEIIKLINDQFRAKIPLSDINLYPTVELP